MQLRPNDKILRFFIPARGMIRSMQFVDNDNCLPCGTRDTRNKNTTGDGKEKRAFNKGVTPPQPEESTANTKKVGYLCKITLDSTRTILHGLQMMGAEHALREHPYSQQKAQMIPQVSARARLIYS